MEWTELVRETGWQTQQQMRCCGGDRRGGSDETQLKWSEDELGRNNGEQRYLRQEDREWRVRRGQRAELRKEYCEELRRRNDCLKAPVPDTVRSRVPAPSV